MCIWVVVGGLIGAMVGNAVHDSDCEVGPGSFVETAGNCMFADVDGYFFGGVIGLPIGIVAGVIIGFIVNKNWRSIF